MLSSFTQKRNKSAKTDGGFALTTVMALGTVIFATTLVSFNRMLTAKHGAIRQSHAEDARELAEAGIAHTIENLNSEYPYLLINQYSDGNYANSGNWGNPTFPSSRCPALHPMGIQNSAKTSNSPKAVTASMNFALREPSSMAAQATSK